MRKRKRFSGVNESDLESDCWWLRLVGANVKELRSHDLEGLLSRRRQLLLLLLLLLLIIILFIFPCSRFSRVPFVSLLYFLAFTLLGHEDVCK